MGGVGAWGVVTVNRVKVEEGGCKQCMSMQVCVDGELRQLQ